MVSITVQKSAGNYDLCILNNFRYLSNQDLSLSKTECCPCIGCRKTWPNYNCSSRCTVKILHCSFLQQQYCLQNWPHVQTNGLTDKLRCIKQQIKMYILSWIYNFYIQKERLSFEISNSHNTFIKIGYFFYLMRTLKSILHSFHSLYLPN